jgi:hypothetical protein
MGHDFQNEVQNLKRKSGVKFSKMRSTIFKMRSIISKKSNVMVHHLKKSLVKGHDFQNEVLKLKKNKA